MIGFTGHCNSMTKRRREKGEISRCLVAPLCFSPFSFLLFDFLLTFAPTFTEGCSTYCWAEIIPMHLNRIMPA